MCNNDYTDRFKIILSSGLEQNKIAVIFCCSDQICSIVLQAVEEIASNHTHSCVYIGIWLAQNHAECMIVIINEVGRALHSINKALSCSPRIVEEIIFVEETGDPIFQIVGLKL